MEEVLINDIKYNIVKVHHEFVLACDECEKSNLLGGCKRSHCYNFRKKTTLYLKKAKQPQETQHEKDSL